MKPNWLPVLEKINQFEKGDFQRGFENLGLHIIFFDDFSEISTILQAISA